MSDNVVRLNHVKDNKRMEEIKNIPFERKKEYYKGEFSRFEAWCSKQHYQLDYIAAEMYLLTEIEEKGVRLNTFNRKAAALKFYLKAVLGEPPEEFTENIIALRQLYNYEPYLEKKGIEPFTYAMRKEDVIRLLEKYNTANKTDIRIYAICFVNLITANRPSEMVRLQVKDFDFERREVLVKLVKQKTTHRKRLTLDCIVAVRKYISEFKLKPEDYFVGKVDRWGNYTSSQILENTYRQAVKKWTLLAPYTLRKTQITSMHRNKADLATIAKQSGHKSVQTISEHYIKLDTSDLDEYI